MYIPRLCCLKGIILDWLHSPRVDEDALVSLLAAYDLDSSYSLKPLSGESRSNNVLVSTDRGRWMLKAYKASLDAEAIAFEHSLLKHLAACGFPAPRLVPTRSGETCVQHEERHYTLFEYVAGRPFDRCLLSPSRRRMYATATARTLARYHQTVEGFVLEGRKLDGYRSDNLTRWRDHHWFAEQVACYREHLRTRPSQDSLLSDRLAVVQHELSDLGERLSHEGVTAARLAIHGDVGPYNLLIRPDGSVMLLDFECAHLELRAYDVISALLAFSSRRSGSISLTEAIEFFNAYQDIWPLKLEEIQLMPALFRYVKLSGLVWRLWDAVTQEHPLEPGWLWTRLARADRLAEHAERLVAVLLQGTAYHRSDRSRDLTIVGETSVGQGPDRIRIAPKHG